MKAANDNWPVRYGPWPVTRADAVRLGTKHYFTGIPCKYGHIDARSTKRRMCSACDAAFDRLYRSEHPERRAASFADWKAENIDKIRSNDLRRRQRNPEAHRQKSRDRRAAVKKVGGTFTIEDVSRMLIEQNYQCVYCKTSLRERREVDHIMPISRGGTNGPENLQMLCPSCNRKKQAQDPLVFERKIGIVRVAA